MNNAEIQRKMKSIKGKIEKWIEQGRLREAMVALDDYEAMIPGDSEICSMRAVIHIIEGSLDKAESALEKGLEKDTTQFDLLFNLAYIRELEGKAQEAANLYCKAETVAYEGAQRQNVNEAVERVKAANEGIEIKERARIVFFVRAGMDSFLGDIINGLSEHYWVRKIIVEDFKQIDEGVMWADICWFEWCDELIAYGSKLPAANQKKIVCRLHRYEVFTNYPAEVAWENVDKLIIVTSHLKQLLETTCPDISKRVELTVIENGVDIERYKFKKRTNGFNLAMVGYIHTRKNPMLVLQIIEKLVRLDRRYKLYVAGQFQEQVIELYWDYQVKRMGLADNVIFEGWQDNINQWLEDKNYLVSTSIHESFGYGIAEAMARGIKPVIHDFLYANDIWSEELLFNTVDEAVESISKGQYESEQYRAFIENNYSLKKQLGLVNELLFELSSFTRTIQKVRDIIGDTVKPQELSIKSNTVLIPCYNRAKMIKEDIEKNYKLGKQPKMVVDDCSNSEKEWLLLLEDDFRGTDSKLIRREANGGVAESRRSGLQAIDTRYTTFIDDDNMMFCLDDKQAMEDISRLEDDSVLVTPRYVINSVKGKLSLGNDRICYSQLDGAQILRELASSGEMNMLLTGGSIGITKFMLEHSFSPLFRVSEDYLMLARMLASKPTNKIRITEGLAFVRRFPEERLTSNQDHSKLALSLISQAIACYYCLQLDVADKDEVLKWMKDRAALIQQIYNFGESFETELVAYLKGEIGEDDFVWVLGKKGIEIDKRLDELAPELRKLRSIFCVKPVKQNNQSFKAIHGDEGDSKERIKSFSDICKNLYNVNLIESLSNSSKLFSVVIPTRNSAKYLRHTLMTCINQSFDDYEIIVSDNSTPGNDDTLRLVKELDSKKIRYIKPDRELTLAKSFEFAYLNSQGEYIFGLGSDDALLFHSLDSLSGILKKYNNEKVILWDKLFYCWPGVSDKSQENLFFVSRMYQKDKINLSYLDTDVLLRQILNFDVSMYMLPMAYINSAIHRSVIKKFIDKTGRFIDGLSQDVYTGLMNLALFDRILYIMYPFTIAGLSKNSIGFASYNEPNNQVVKDGILLRDKFDANYTNRYLPQTVKYDRKLLVAEFLRIIDKRINNWNPSMVNWKMFFALCTEFIKNDDASFREKMDDIHNTIKVHNNRELEHWFDENYYYNRNFLESKVNKLSYQKGFFSEANSLRIDMSTFGVDNVYDVAKFFNNLFNLD